MEKAINMKKVLYMAMSLNGYIAKENNATPWSEEEWNIFSEKVKEFGCIIVGRKTYQIMKDNNEFQKISNPLTVVISKRNTDERSSNFVFLDSPEKALTFLEEKAFDKVLIAGGSVVNTSFLEKKLIDEIYLDIEPIIFGKGIRLFQEIDIETDLELLEIKKLSKNTMQVHYKIAK